MTTEDLYFTNALKHLSTDTLRAMLRDVDNINRDIMKMDQTYVRSIADISSDLAHMRRALTDEIMVIRDEDLITD